LQPARTNCTFVPDIVNLNNLGAGVVQGFSASGSACGDAGNVGGGAMSGPFTISGKVVDPAGKRILGGKVTLSGGTSGVRFTDFSGGCR